MRTFSSSHSSMFLLIIIALLLLPSISWAWTCESSCGGIPLSYPFGSGWNCGSPSFQPYVNCTHNKLLFYTPTGTYSVQSIDYINDVMIVVDLQMSNCNAMGLSGAFGLPIGAPFAFASFNTIALIGCSSTSSLYSKQTCDASQHQVCDSLYGCQGIKQIGIQPNSLSSSCCVLSSSMLATPPYEIDLPLLQCTTYTSVYHMGSMQNPQMSWLYGIALKFNAGSPPTPQSAGNGDHPTCYVCQEAQGLGSPELFASVSQARSLLFEAKVAWRPPLFGRETIGVFDEGSREWHREVLSARGWGWSGEQGTFQRVRGLLLRAPPLMFGMANSINEQGCKILKMGRRLVFPFRCGDI
ncbi:hypothetical protein L7F22_023556 [Adiantum nelumboides]|nr:hypothetical protein [Adiantum nelumboides]